MDDKCKHVLCPECSPKNLQPDGICPTCSVLRSPIKAHDNSYHRSDCGFYSESNERQKYQPERCVSCKLAGKLCDPPRESFKEFISRSLGRDLYKLIRSIRRNRPLKCQDTQ